MLLEKDNWPGMIQISFIERDETKTAPADAARIYLEDTLEERDIPFPREAVKVENGGKIGRAVIDYTVKNSKEPAHWRVWFIVDKTRAIMAAYICDPEHEGHELDEASTIIADLEFIASTND